MRKKRVKLSRAPAAPASDAQQENNKPVSPAQDGKQNDFIELLTYWYKSYYQIIIFLATVAIGLLAFSATFILKELIVQGQIQSAIDLTTIKWSWGFLGVSVLACMCTILCVYNWYVSGIEAEIQKTSFDAKALGESFRYRLRMGKMGLWGYASLDLGWIAGIALFIGITVFVLGMWEILGAVERERLRTFNKVKTEDSTLVNQNSSDVKGVPKRDSLHISK